MVKLVNVKLKSGISGNSQKNNYIEQKTFKTILFIYKILHNIKLKLGN